MNPNDQSLPSDLIIPFTYIVTITLAGNGSAQSTLTMAADSSFELLGFVASCTADADTDVIPNGFSVLITDQSTGRNLANARVPQRMFASSTYNGMTQEKYPVRFPASCVLLFDCLDLSGGANTVVIGLKGYKLFAQR